MAVRKREDDVFPNAVGIDVGGSSHWGWRFRLICVQVQQCVPLLKTCATKADLPYAPELSGHSFRRGLATSAHRAGAGFKNIKHQGGWRHDGTVQGYIDEAGQFEENAAGSLLRRHTDPA